ncbi:hypothetical protein ATY75_23710 [Rhizobium sp. N122]|nr:hypothetical protein ATY75_23710 [Rhizobium sp. N122]
MASHILTTGTEDFALLRSPVLRRPAGTSKDEAGAPTPKKCEKELGAVLREFGHRPVHDRTELEARTFNNGR